MLGIFAVLLAASAAFYVVSTREAHATEAWKQLAGAEEHAKKGLESFETYLQTAEQEAALAQLNISQEASFIRLLGTINVIENRLLEAQNKFSLGQFIGAMLALSQADKNISLLKEQGFSMFLASEVSRELHEAFGER